MEEGVVNQGIAKGEDETKNEDRAQFTVGAREPICFWQFLTRKSKNQSTVPHILTAF